MKTTKCERELSERMAYGSTALVSMNTVVVWSEVYFELRYKWTECEHLEPRTTERELQRAYGHYHIVFVSFRHPTQCDCLRAVVLLCLLIYLLSQ